MPGPIHERISIYLGLAHVQFQTEHNLHCLADELKKLPTHELTDVGALANMWPSGGDNAYLIEAVTQEQNRRLLVNSLPRLEKEVKKK
jgi:hypothetical protein